jgi:hypothetical protein
MTLEDILYTPVESLNHAVCLRRLWWGQTMVDAEVAAQRVEPLFAGCCTLAQAKETVSKISNEGSLGPRPAWLEH